MIDSRPSYADPAALPRALTAQERTQSEIRPAPAGICPSVIVRLPHAILFRPAPGRPAQWLRLASCTH